MIIMAEIAYKDTENKKEPQAIYSDEEAAKIKATISQLYPAKLEIPEEKAQEADIKLTKLIKEGIIKNVSYGQELASKEIKPCNCAHNLNEFFKNINNINDGLNQGVPPSEGELNRLKEDIENTAKFCKLSEYFDIKEAINTVNNLINYSKSMTAPEINADITKTGTKVFNAVRECKEKE